MKVKIFESFYGAEVLEKEINKWLVEQGLIKICYITQSSTALDRATRTTISIFYGPEAVQGATESSAFWNGFWNHS